MREIHYGSTKPPSCVNRRFGTWLTGETNDSCALLDLAAFGINVMHGAWLESDPIDGDETTFEVLIETGRQMRATSGL